MIGGGAETGPAGLGRLARQSALTGVAAFASVVAGLGLSVVIAASFGAGHNTDAFFVGARIPLSLVAVAMTAANQALVPSFSTWFVKRSEKEALRSVACVLFAVVLAGAALAGLVGLLAGVVVRITAPGLTSADAALAASVCRVMLLILPLTGAAEVLRALLNARSAFVAPAAMNVVMSGVAAVIVVMAGRHDVHVIGWAYVAGAGCQLAFMMVLARRHGFRYRSGSPFGNRDVAAVAGLSGRPLVAAGLNPVARLGEQLLVSFLPVGSITLLNYGMTLVNAIGGAVFFRSVMVTLLPRLTTASAAGDEEGVRRTTVLGIELMLAVAIPLTAFMAILAKPAARALFIRGHFSRADASLLGALLAVYAASLVGSGVQRALLAPFFARLDTRVPLRNTFYGMAANLLLLPVCVLPWGRGNRNAILGVALAYSLAQYVNVAHAAARLRRAGGEVAVPPRWVLCLVASTAASAVAMLVGGRVVHIDGRADRLSLLAKTAGTGALGLGVLAAVLVLLGAHHVRTMTTQLRHRRGAEPPTPVQLGDSG